MRRVHDDPNSQRTRFRATVDGKARNFVAHLGRKTMTGISVPIRIVSFLDIMCTLFAGGFQEVKKVVMTNAPVGGEPTLLQPLQPR